MRDEKRRNKDDDAGFAPKKRRSDDSPSHLTNQSHSSASSKARSHVPMSERQQFALLRQLETEEVTSDRGDPAANGSLDAARGDLSRDTDTSADHGFSKEESEGGLYRNPSHHHYHQSTSARERAGTSASSTAVGEKSVGKLHGSSTIQGALMHLIKTGDLDTLKQLVRDGANVNEQDEHGWTALHEFSARNLSRLVAYLLRHGARPDLTDRNGDTALHAAARASHAHRVLRTLLRHNADPMITNIRGERPLDLCHDTESSVILKQHMELMHGRTGHHPSAKYSSTSTSRLPRHHHHPSHAAHPPSHVMRHSSASAILLSNDVVVSGTSRSANAMTTSDLNSDSDDACSTPGVSNPSTGPSSTLFPGMTTTEQLTAAASAGRSASPSSTANQRGGSFGLEHTPAAVAAAAAKPVQKKDPYAFEDEADECPDPGASLHPTSSGLLGKSSSASTASGAPNTTNTTSPTGSIRSRAVPGSGGPIAPISVPSAPLTSATLAPPPPPPAATALLSSPSATTTVTTTTPESSGSDATVSPGPPLRLRFAKEAGQYTLMEQQQQQQQQQNANNSTGNNQDVSGSQSTSAIDSSELMPIGAEYDRASNQNNKSDNNNNNTSPTAQQQTQPNNESSNAPGPGCLSTTGIGNSSIGTIAIGGDGSVGGAGSNGSILEDADSASVCADLATEDGSTAQKVPPLRIKVASGPSNDTESTSAHTAANGVNQTTSETAKGIERDLSTAVELRTGEPKTNTIGGGIVDSLSVGESLDSSAGTAMDQTDPGSGKESTEYSGGTAIKHKSPDLTASGESQKASTLGATAEHTRLGLATGEPEAEESRTVAGFGQASDDGAMSSSSFTAKAESESGSETGKETTSGKDTTHRHRSGRTLRSHTAAQREREEKERHNDTTPIKKRKLRSRTEPHSDGGSARSDTGSWTPNDNTMVNISGTVRTSGNSDDTVPHESTGETNSTAVGSDPLPNSSVKEEPATPVEPRTTAIKLDAMKEERDEDMEGDDDDNRLQVNKLSPDTNDRKPSTMKVELETEHKMDQCDSPGAGSYKPLIASTSAASSSSSATVSASAASTSMKAESADASGDGISYLYCPAGPDDSKQHPELLMFENPFEKSAAIQRKLRELINNLVEVHPKAPCGYQDYLLVTRNYLLASQTPALTKKTAPAQLKPAFVELFNEQEEERYAQALKHQSEREHLRLCAEQAVLRAQTRAALAVANLSKPLSFCSVLAYKDLTYVPPAGKTEQRDEESVRDRFTPRTFIGWLEDIKDTFQQEKKKLLCRQLHEAESLMMVQRLDWESKLRESQLHDYGTDVLREIPHYHVPLIQVPNDFPLFAHDPVHRTSLS